VGRLGRRVLGVVEMIHPQDPDAYRDDGIEEVELDDIPDPTHECMTCGWPEWVDDHKRHAPNWCFCCEEITTFKKT